MAAMLSPSTLLSRARAPASAPGKLLSPTAALQLRKQPAAAAAASAVALPWSRSRRASIFTCHADAGNAAKFNYDDLQPSVLETGSTLFAFEPTPAGGVEALRKASTLLAGENWSMMGDRDVIILKLRVGKQPPPNKDDKEKATAGWFSTSTASTDQAGLQLLIKYTGSDEQHPASSLDKTLATPRDYDPKRVQQVEHKWFEEWLLVIIDKGLPR